VRAGVRYVQSSTALRAVSMKEPYGLKSGSIEGNTGIIPGSEGYQNVVRVQKLWSVEDGTMVWQKKPSDKAAYNATLAGCAVGALYCLYQIFVMSFPKKPE